MKSILLHIFICGCLFSSLQTIAQVPKEAKWNLVKADNNIKVFTSPVGNTGRKYIKVSAQLNGTIDQVKAIFQTIPQQKEWVYGTKQSYLIQKVNDNQLLYYNETSLPWPVSNRDVAINMKLEEDATKQQLVIIQEDAPDAIDPHKGIVRVPHLNGYWRFSRKGENAMQAEYYLDITPGGSLPLWVVNMFVAKGPYETFENLRRLLATETTH